MMKSLKKNMEIFPKSRCESGYASGFSWAKLEPEEGRYEFEWLDKIMGTLLKNHINVFLSTPTVAQPAWLSKKYPEVLPTDISGRKRTHGDEGVLLCE